MELWSGNSSYIKGIGALPHQNIITQIKSFLLLFPSCTEHGWYRRHPGTGDQNWDYTVPAQQPSVAISLVCPNLPWWSCDTSGWAQKVTIRWKLEYSDTSATLGDHSWDKQREFTVSFSNEVEHNGFFFQYSQQLKSIKALFLRFPFFILTAHVLIL